MARERSGKTVGRGVSSVVSGGTVILGLSPENYAAHTFHTSAEAWAETNCYTDVWIELLHTLGLEPLALLPFGFGADFEGDQWTFLKPSPSDVWELYGLDVQELNLWDDLAGHVGEQVRRGNLSLVEVDSFYLPDTRGTAYQTEHAKTTIAINAIDFERRHLGYFHNAGYYELAGEDFSGVLRIGNEQCPNALAPYAEFIKLKRRVHLSPERLRETSLELARQYLSRRPLDNPFTAYRAVFARDVETLLTRPATYYHKYAFASLRQMGTGFLLAATYVEWLQVEQDLGLGEAARAFNDISDAAKMLMLKLARAVNRNKPFEGDAAFDAMEANWQIAFALLDARIGGDSDLRGAK